MKYLNMYRSNVDYYNDILNIEEVFSQDGKSHIKLPITESLKAPLGMVFGAVIYALAEASAAFASATLNNHYVTMDSSINYLNPAVGEYLLAEAEVIHKGDSSSIVEIIIYDDNEDLIAKAMITMFKIDASAL